MPELRISDFVLNVHRRHYLVDAGESINQGSSFEGLLKLSLEEKRGAIVLG